MMFRVLVVLVFLLLSGCNAAPPTPVPGNTSQPLVDTATPEPTLTATPEPLPANCTFVWSNRKLPDLALQVTGAFRAHQMPEVEVDASAYGEDCIDPATNEVRGFSAMQTDFFFAVAISDTGDKQQMGEYIENIYLVLDAFPPGGEVPGTNPGYIGIAFSSGAEPVNLWFLRSAGAQAIAAGLQGSALFDALADPSD